MTVSVPAKWHSLSHTGADVAKKREAISNIFLTAIIFAEAHIFSGLKAVKSSIQKTFFQMCYTTSSISGSQCCNGREPPTGSHSEDTVLLEMNKTLR